MSESANQKDNRELLALLRRITASETDGMNRQHVEAEGRDDQLKFLAATGLAVITYSHPLFENDEIEASYRADKRVYASEAGRAAQILIDAAVSAERQINANRSAAKKS